MFSEYSQTIYCNKGDFPEKNQTIFCIDMIYVFMCKTKINLGCVVVCPMREANMRSDLSQPNHKPHTSMDSSTKGHAFISYKDVLGYSLRS